MMILRKIAILLISGLISCNTAHDRQDVRKAPGKKEMAELNKYMVEKDRERIQNYIERKKLHMSESGSGLWYQIISEGNGDYFSDNDRIVMEYECYLIDGTRCYDSKESGPKEIILGRSGLESGLGQGLRMLKPGGEAIFILPPFLAYGFVGDGKKIPPRAVVVYNISVQLVVN
ncbi:MAG: FKBP-type peptidyl-prolyl cis-trans isomerase [Bacteroidota bacterium]